MHDRIKKEKRKKKKNQRKAAVWGPSIGQGGLMSCCRVTVQSQCLALPTSFGCWPIPSPSICTASPSLGLWCYWKGVQGKHCQDSCLLWGRSRKKWGESCICNESLPENGLLQRYLWKGRQDEKHIYEPTRSNNWGCPGQESTREDFALIAGKYVSIPQEFQLPFDNNC